MESPPPRELAALAALSALAKLILKQSPDVATSKEMERWRARLERRSRVLRARR